MDERELCETYAPRVRAFGIRHLRDAAAADDLVQVVLLAVLAAYRAGRIENLGAYVLGTARNAVMDIRRGEARQRKVAERAALPDGYIPSYPGVDRLRLENCLGELEARDRSVVLASFLDDRDADEIAAAMQLSTGNVRVIRHRALAKLHDCVERA